MDRKRTYSPNGTAIVKHLLAGMSFLLVACSEPLEPEPVVDKVSTDTLQLAAYSQNYLDEQLTTRGVADDYIKYTMGPVSVYMTYDDPTPPTEFQPGRFVYNASADKWHSTISVTEGQTYYIYGYSPEGAASSSSIAPLSGLYANGCALTLKDVNAVTDKDLCIVVGAAGAEPETSAVPASFKLGSFRYEGKAKGGNYAFLVLHHLYAQLAFKMKVDQSYNQIRTIKVKKMEISSAPLTYDVTINLSANNSGSDPMGTANWVVKNSAASEPFFEDEEGMTLDETAQEISSFMIRPFVDLTLKCTYDVYDKKTAEPIRKDCVAENKLGAKVLNLLRGQKSTIVLTVQPTYLYILSDEDEPTIIYVKE